MKRTALSGAGARSFHARVSPQYSWSKIKGQTSCGLLARSAAPVLSSDDYLSYTDCEGTTQTSADKRLYRAFYSTVTLRNKAGY